MASGKIKGITVEIGGDTTKLGKAIGDSEKQTRSLQGELKQVEKLLKLDPSNIELVSQKQDILTQAVAETTKKLDTLKEAEAQVIAQFEQGKIGEDQLRAFQREIIKTENELNDFENDLSSLNNTLSDTGGDVRNTSSEFDTLTETIGDQEKELSDLRDEYIKVVVEQGKNSDEAKNLASQMKELNSDLKDNKKKLSDAENNADQFSDALDNVGNSAEDSSGGFTIMKGALADLVSNVIQDAISAIGDFIESILELSEATEEYRQMQSKLEGSSKSFGYSVDFANEKYKEFYKYLGDDQASTNAITNLMGIGAETETVSSLVDGATAVWASYGDSIPIESLTESINETITCGKITGTFADTINWCKESNEGLNNALSGNKEAQQAFNDALKEGLPVEDAFNEALAKISDEQERADVVAKFLNETYGESKKTYDETATSIMDANEAELELKETQAQLGEAVAPVNNALTSMKNQALEAITPLVQDLANGFMDLYNWLQKNPAVMQALVAVAIALASAFTVLAGALAIQGIITGVTKAMAFLNTTILANPITLIIALIAGLVVAFIYLWTNCEAFRDFWINLWEKIKEVASTVKDALVEFFTVTIPNAWATFKTKTSELITSVVDWFKQLPEKISNAIQGVIGRVTEWASNLKTKATEGAKNCVNAVVNWFAQLPYNIGYAIGFVIGKLVLWSENVINWITTNVPIIINSIITFFQELPGKIWTFLVNTVDRIVTWGNDMKTKASSAVESLITSVITFFQELPGKIWNAIVDAVDYVATWGNTMKTKATSAIQNLVSSVISTMRRLPSEIWSAISGAISNMVTWGSQMLSKAKTAVNNVKQSIIDGLRSIPDTVSSIGRNIVEGLWNGISNATSWIKDKVASFASGILDGMKSALGINSPSRVFRDEVGRYIAEGIGVGITNNADSPLDALQTLTDDMTNQDLNGATIERQLNATFNGNASNVIGVSDKDLLSKLDGIYERLGHLQVVTDTGALVGEMIDKIDASLATKQLLSARGV